MSPLSQEGHFGAFRSRQLLESQARYGGSKSPLLQAEPFREQDLLESLLLRCGRFHPQTRRIAQNVFRKPQQALYIDFVYSRILQFDPGERDVLSDLVALTFIGGRVDAFLVEKGVLQY